jgi:hypothetical protein
MDNEKRKLEDMINEKIHDPKEREIIRRLIEIKLSEEQERKFIERNKMSPERLKQLEKMAIDFYNAIPDEEVGK